MRRWLLFASGLFALVCVGSDRTATSPTDPDSAEASTADALPTDAADAAPPSLRDDGMAPPFRWDEMAQRVVDSSTLKSGLSAAGYAPPAGTEIYAAVVQQNAHGQGYALFDYGAGAFSQSFWPASTIKLLSSLAALDYVQSHGFTGAATVTWKGVFSDVVHNIVRRAIQKSNNQDYDRTVQIAGLDQLNATWLTAARGFPHSVIKASYGKLEVKNPPGYTLTEGEKSKVIPARAAKGTYACKGGRSNCTNLFELTEAVRRLVWHDAISEAERFDLPAADRAVLENALCTAIPSFFKAGVDAALGDGARICHKPGWMPGSDSLDHGVIEAADGRRFMLAAAVPDPGDSSSQAKLARIAKHTLSVVAALSNPPFFLQPDAGEHIVIEASPARLRVSSAGADAVELFIDGKALAASPPTADGVFSIGATPSDYVGRLVTLRSYAAGSLTGVRNVALAAPN